MTRLVTAVGVTSCPSRLRQWALYLVLISTKLIIGTTGIIFFEGNVWTRGYDKDLCQPGPAFDQPRSVGPTMELPECKGAVFFFSTFYFTKYICM